MTLLVAVLLSSLPLAPAASMGRVVFPVSCNAPAQRAFVRGVSALHSFWYDEARAQFQAAEKADPKCAMAWWGEAMSHVELLWIDDDTDAARAALARMPGEPPTARERAWVAALRPLLTNEDAWPRRAAFAAAMDGLVRAFPDDEAKAFDALAQLTAHPDMPLADRARAGALALEVLAHNPNHPGAAHYAIHAFDTPELAPLGLPAARRYAEIAPAAFHARHMPAHIFSRLGMWPEALASCQSAVAVSAAWVERAGLTADKRDLHSLGWVVLINEELGRPRAAEAALADYARVVTTTGKARGGYVDRVWRWLRQSGDWARADELLAPVKGAESAPPVVTAAAACHAPAKPYAEWLALDLARVRAWAASARHDAAATKELVAKMKELRRRVADADERAMGKEQHELEQRIAALSDDALVAAAAHDDATAAKKWQAVAALEAGEPPPEGADGVGGAHLRAGEALMRLRRWKEAEAELTASLAQFPGRAATMADLARVADQRGDLGGARRWWTEAAAQWKQAEPDFAPAKEARAWLAAHPVSAAAPVGHAAATATR